jgi:hypothetical protein
MDPHEAGIDRLLRRSMASPVPVLSPDFDQRLMNELRQSLGQQSPTGKISSPLDRYRQVLLASYGLISVVVSAAIMRAQGLGWGPIAGTILVPLALVAVVSAARRASLTTLRHSAK